MELEGLVGLGTGLESLTDLVELDSRQFLYPAAVVLLGQFSLVGHVYHFLHEEELAPTLLGILAPLALSIVLIGAGIGLYRSDLQTPGTRRVMGWTVVGVAGGLVFGYPVVPYQATHDVMMVDVQFLLINWLTVGAIAGVLIGYYDARRGQYRSSLEAERAELVAREAELERENERLEMFASILSHDLRNPLTVAAGRTELARETGELSHLASVRDALDRMETIIDEMLTIAREGETIDAAETEQVVLGEIVQTCWRSMETDDAEFELESDLEFQAVPTRLKHVFENLVRNAVEHTNGPVTVRVGSLGDGTGFYVEDDGPGIPMDDRETVFEPGFTTDANGTGYGLYVVNSITEAHGWDVTVTESSNGGARFEFSGIDG